MGAAWPRSQTLQLVRHGLVRHGKGHIPCNLSAMAKAKDSATCQVWPKPHTVQPFRHGQGHRPCNLSAMAKATETLQLFRHGQGHRLCNLSGMAKAIDPVTCQALPGRRPCNLSGKASDPATCPTWPGNRPCNLSDMARQQTLQLVRHGQAREPATCQTWPRPQTPQLVRQGQGHRDPYRPAPGFLQPALFFTPQQCRPHWFLADEST